MPAARAALAALLLFGLFGCGGAEERPTSDGAAASLRGVDLVAGSSLQRYGLLVVPRAGGTAELRSLEEPAEVVWSGRARLPASSELHGLEGVAILRTAEGRVYRYSPARDVVEELGRIGPGAVWSASAGHGLWVDVESSTLLAISREGAWRYELARPFTWASPLDDGALVVLVGGESEAELWLLRGGEVEPEAVSRLAVAPPGLATAWGRRLALAAGDGRQLVFVGVPQLMRTGQVELDGRPRALAASPSSHQLYVSTAAGPRLAAVNRFSGAVRSLGSLSGPAEAIRPALFGEYLLAHDGERTWWVPLEGRGPRPLEVEWRRDLPIGLPDYRVLGSRDGSVRLFRLEGEDAGREIGGPADAWWTVVRWRPPRPPVVATRVEGEPRASGPGAEPGGADRPAGESGVAPGPPTGQGGEAAPVERPPAREVVAEAPRAGPDEVDPAEAAEATPREADREVEARGALEAGFYAIVSSSRSLAGVADLAHALTDAGYRARLQRHRDEADEVWFRCLVGPYLTRQAAEGAADRLRAERGLQAWITEVGPEVRAGEMLR